MPSEIAMHLTAHDFTSFAAFFEYIDCTRAGCMPGSVVLGGWEPLPWGHMGKGPVPPSLTVLEESGVNMEAIEMLIDVLFRLDSALPGREPRPARAAPGRDRWWFSRSNCSRRAAPHREKTTGAAPSSSWTRECAYEREMSLTSSR